MSTLFEWRIREIEQKADRAVSRLYELDSLRSDVDRLECANRELGAKVDELRARLEAAFDQVQQLQSTMTEGQQ